ncbi:PAS domain-containing sensor histidine kinase [Flavobacterium undicola]|uniref:PAS domain-containing sensor histidine kinase n=1 Tax=Flavobacterium undicola TaxID=1932779 RepID=UPI001377CA40|nr:PAS domain-containing sensor histidine kinase [Flavobacterium undicola]MBA0883733.1 PAS domain S-box protein [Flavobacterium undicola]
MINKQEIFNKTAETLKIGVWDINLKTNAILWDSKTKEIFEVSENFIPNYETTLAFFNRKNLIHFKSLIKKATENKLPIHGKFQIITAKKAIKYLECICQIDFIGNEINRIYGTFRDITFEEERKIALESAAEKFSSVFYSANDAIIIIDTKTGYISDCNNRTYELTGYNDTELIGFHNSILFPVDKRTEIQFYLKNKIKSNTYFVKETTIKTKEETIIPVQVASGKKFIIDNQSYLVCFLRNITKKKQIEENLSLLSLVASETTDSIIITDSEGKAIWANQAYMTLTDLTLEEIIGQEPNYFSIGFETNIEKIKKIQKALENKQETKVVFQNYNKRKEKYWLELNITPVFDNHGICRKFVGIGRDITAAKEKEIELKNVLEVTSHQNNKLLNFAHIVSHNIRSHTSNLAMVLDVIENTDDAVEKLSFIDMFKEGTEKLSETIEYLNEVITIQKNINIKKTKINLRGEIEKTAASFSNQIKIVHTIPENLTLNVIPAYLDNIVLNLLSNAIKYKSPERTPLLEISHKTKEGFHIISFKDNGLGINIERNKHKLFGMYKTFHGNEDAKGIGLFIVKNQIEAMKGKIEIESEEGLGSTFKLYFNEK